MSVLFSSLRINLFFYKFCLFYFNLQRLFSIFIRFSAMKKNNFSHITLFYYSLYSHNSDPPVANTSEYLARTETSKVHGIKKKKFFNALTEQCNICHKRFSGQFKLKKHLKKAHNMTLIQTQTD